MPQVDILETAECDGEQPQEEPDLPPPPDFPPESFWLSKDAEFDWFDRNAVYERKESTKGNSNSTNLNPSLNPISNSSSPRFSTNLKSKPSVIGLPKTHKTSYVDTTKRRKDKPTSIRLFPKRSESMGKSEPSSPKVSCMGRVRSKKGRRKPSNSAIATARPSEKGKSSGCRICGCFTAIFGSDRRSKSSVEIIEPPLVESPPRRSVTHRVREFPASAEPEEAAAETPGLGGMNRFASRRRSVSWSTDDVDQ